MQFSVLRTWQFQDLFKALHLQICSSSLFLNLKVYGKKYCPPLASTFPHLTGIVRITFRSDIPTNLSNVLIHYNIRYAYGKCVPLLETSCRSNGG